MCLSTAGRYSRTARLRVQNMEGHFGDQGRLSDCRSQTRKAPMKKAINYLGLSVITLIFIATFAPVSAQTEPPPFTRNDVMIAMRDGVRLNTRIYAPARTDE